MAILLGIFTQEKLHDLFFKLLKIMQITVHFFLNK